MSELPKPYFSAAECDATECRDSECPYHHFGGWMIDGVLGLHDTAQEAIYAASISRLTAERDALKKVAEAAAGLCEEIIASGTHTRWKRTANAIRELNTTPGDTDAKSGGQS